MIDGGPSHDVIDGGPGDDKIRAGSSRDNVTGGEGNDEIWLVSGSDTVDAGPGDDIVHANNGTTWNSVDCGAGADTIYINPTDGSGTGGTRDKYSPITRNREFDNCETVIEESAPVDPAFGRLEKSDSQAGATLTGTERNDNLLGGPGPDQISAGDGDDVIWGHHQSSGESLGTDRIDAGPGKDTVYGSRGDNEIHGGAGDDYLQGGELHNTIWGDDGNDTIKLRGNGRRQVGRNIVHGGAGDDSVTASGTLAATIDCGPGRDVVDVGYNRRARWNSSCEKVRKLYGW